MMTGRAVLSATYRDREAQDSLTDAQFEVLVRAALLDPAHTRRVLDVDGTWYYQTTRPYLFGVAWATQYNVVGRRLTNAEWTRLDRVVKTHDRLLSC